MLVREWPRRLRPSPTQPVRTRQQPHKDARYTWRGSGETTRVKRTRQRNKTGTPMQLVRNGKKGKPITKKVLLSMPRDYRDYKRQVEAMEYDNGF